MSDVLSRDIYYQYIDQFCIAAPGWMHRRPELLDHDKALRARAERANIVKLQEQLDYAYALAKRRGEALKCFLDDERFDVAVGGNPIAVEKMLSEARQALADVEPST